MNPISATNCFTIFLLGVSISIVSCRSPCYVEKTHVSYYYVRVCTCRFLWWCTHRSSVRRTTVRTERHCCPGYRSDCRTPICSSNCQSHGECVAPNVCRCHSGYTGINCQSAVCTPSCINGRCVSPGRCLCYIGYTGSRCDVPVCSPGCQNGGSCVSPNTCQCSNNYGGLYCDQEFCSPPCLNGGSCNYQRCSCTSSYSGSTCEIPVCLPSCQNGGTCVAPNKCVCDETHSGDLCQTTLCSYNFPCFPGTCTESQDCICKAGFGGTRANDLCRSMNRYAAPTIATCNATLANIERTGKKRELYRFMTDSSDDDSSETELLWVNQRNYNYINISFSAFYSLPVDYIPDYIRKFKFGITRGSINMRLSKQDRKGSTMRFVSINNTITNCTDNPGSLSPHEGMFNCHVTLPDFDRLLEHGDNLTITVMAENGGFRKLAKLSSNTNADTDIYKGYTTKKDMTFLFDFNKPDHSCLSKTQCSGRPFTVQEDITKKPIQFIWEGWSDDFSGIRQFKIEAFRLQPNNYNPPSLTEPNALIPLKTFKFPSSANSFTFTPKAPGMYSFVLNVVDKANNTQCSRTLVLYDPHSNVTISPSSQIHVESAVPETGYTWQSGLQDDIMVNWKGHFQNKFHVESRLLIRVKEFQHINWLNLISKQVPPNLDDNDGERTLSPISNSNGIVKFEYNFENINNSVPSIWRTVDDISNESVTFNTLRNDGNTIKVSIRASDIMGNTETDATYMHFDSSSPSLSFVKFTKNVQNLTYPFGSRIELEAYDKDSGIYRVDWTLRANDSGEVLKNGSIPGNVSISAPSETLGWCIPMGNCFYRKHVLDVNNCWLIVHRNSVNTKYIQLDLTVYNMAFLPASSTTVITDLASLDGIEKYTGPINLHVAKKLENGVRLRWTLTPSCYERSRITVIFKSSDGTFQSLTVDKDADWVDLTGLTPETNYTLKFVTAYGRHTSDPVQLSFTTNPAKPFLSSGGIAGISIVIIILLGIIILGVILWRTGRLSIAKEGIQRRVSVYARRINYRFSRASQHNPDEDDIYLYGQMDFSNSAHCNISHTNIVLDTLLTNGRFADIYKARYYAKDDTQSVVVAKIMRSGYTEEMELLMKAKINFYASQVDSDPNILKFIGAVTDNPSLGPYMLLEYCEIGQLRNWLLQKKNTTNDDTLEILYRISYGISKGMYHLESKKIVHRKLAARNILLNEMHDPKIAGFGPDPTGQDTSNEEGSQANDREKIPIKWTAPECLATLKTATSKSDVWSYGIVLWEIFSFGETPYPDIRSRDIQSRLKTGYRLNRPEFASDLFYNLMSKCWHTKPKQRPTFRDISAEIGKMFNTAPSDDYYYYSQK